MTGIDLWIDIEAGYCEYLLSLMTYPDATITDIIMRKRKVRHVAVNGTIDAVFFPRGGVLILAVEKELILGTIGPKKVLSMRCANSTKVTKNPLLCEKCFDFSGILQTNGFGASEVHIPDVFVCSRCFHTWQYEDTNPHE